MTVTFHVPGSPAPQGSKRHVGGGKMIESSRHVGPWRERVAWFATQAMRTAPYTGAVAVTLQFVLPRPKSAPARKALPATKRPDADKLARACLDALTAICFLDDSQVVKLVVTKRIALPGEQPGCQITVSEGD